MNVQLYAYEAGIRYQLDLYPEQPIKITLSAEEITDPTQVNSTFSRQFRIPATNNNSKFFKYWYTSGVVDFDVTQKVTAEIHVDGILYTTGQLRLVAAYDNGSADRIDFEVVFLGETKTFSSQVGDGYMNSIDCTDAAHVLSLPLLENTWLEPWSATVSYVTGDYVWHSAPSYNNPLVGDTWVATANSTGSEPDLVSSDWNRVTTSLRVPSPVPVRYIVADRGNLYEENNQNQIVVAPVPGAIAASEVSVDKTGHPGLPESHPASFTNQANPLYLTQFTPIIQVKYLIDKIFAQTDYRYTSDSTFNEEWFQQLYIDGIATGFPFTPSGNGESSATTLAQEIPDPTDVPHPFPLPLTFPIVQQNNANAYNNTTGVYTIPVNGPYTFEMELLGRLDEISLQYDCEITIAIFRNGSQVASATQGGPGPFLFGFEGNDKLTYSGNFSAGDEVNCVIRDLGAGNPETSEGGYVIRGAFRCTATPQQIAVNDLLKTDLKIIDWFKSILTKFRLVMVPTVQDPSLFTIKPWEEYIASGETFDWTYKLDHNKDIKLEPLFFSQKADITFTDQEDIDQTNKYQQDTFGNPYGTRFFVSGNDLLSDTTIIDTEFAPTPVSQIDGCEQIDSQFIIPKFFENGDDFMSHGHFTHQPITPVQRLLFWNGLRPTTTNTDQQANQQIEWQYTDNVNQKSSDDAPLLKGGIRRYPAASYLSDIPTTNTTLNLNWKKQFPYFAYPGAPNTIGQLGQDVFVRYWQNYIDNVYSPNARKMTAYFNLDSEDLRTLTFDDIIFIKDSYWRILKVVDAPLGEIATVKVELIKLLDYVTPVGALQFDPADFLDVVDVSSGGSNDAFAVRQDEVWDAYTEEISQDDGNQIP